MSHDRNWLFGDFDQVMQRWHALSLRDQVIDHPLEVIHSLCFANQRSRAYDNRTTFQTLFEKTRVKGRTCGGKDGGRRAVFRIALVRVVEQFDQTGKSGGSKLSLAAVQELQPEMQEVLSTVVLETSQQEEALRGNPSKVRQNRQT